MTRDPKIDPAPGDALCLKHGDGLAVVDAAGDEIRYRIRLPGIPDNHVVVPLAEWRQLARNTMPVAERLTRLQNEREAIVVLLAKVDETMAWFRSAK